MKKLLLLIVIINYTVAFSQETYYDDVNLELFGADLKDALATKIKATHTRVLEYTSNGPDVWDATKETDDYVELSGDVMLFYGWENGSDQDITNDISRDNRLQDIGDGATDVWNREHVFPKSLANPILDITVPGAATDAHHLRAADRSRNSARNNRKYGRGIGTSDYSTLDFHEGLDGPDTAAWYPGDQWKGDAARMIMYMYLHYGTVCLPTAVGVGSKEFTQDEMIDLFLQWNVEDPVSDIEKTRNAYHENTSNYAAQGNRNPFIDNPYLATRIWGGDSAEDRWNYYKNTDTEAPTTPTNLTLSDIAFSSINISWSASSDNIGVTGYNVYVDDVLTAQTASSITNTTISNLSTNTSYNFAIIAKDLINNRSTSATLTGKTLEDTQAPTTPAGLVVSNETDSSFKISWTASTDNNAVSNYDVFVDDVLNATSTAISYTVNGLNTSTTYKVEIVAKDIDNNPSAKSTSINATTTTGASNGITELFISEYIEPSAANNKAIEIVNLTGSTINLSEYSIQKFSSTGWIWKDDYPLGNANIVPGDVFVIVHADTNNSELLNAADMLGPPNIDTSPYAYGSPLNFNGDDPIGLYKNGELIDVIGDISSRSKHIEDVTYRRKGTISAPNTTYDEQGEWESFPANTFDGIGSHTSTLSTKDLTFESFKMYPNPTNGNYINFSVTEDAVIHIYNVLGKLMQSSKVTRNKNNIDISKFSTGIYLLKINSGKQFITKKLIIN
jgi:endonuclease I/chitodextrinase